MGEEMQNQKELLELTDFLVKTDNSWAEIDPNEVVNTFSLVSKLNIPQKEEDADDNNCDCGDGRETESTYEYIPLFIATRTGISQIVEKILKCHPQAVEAHDIKHQQNILHMAIKYRRLAIFKIVKKNKFITSRLADLIDSDWNTILHHAADMSYFTDTNYYSVDAKGTYGPAFQLQEELQWMARVQKIIPLNYTMHRNKKGMTADELFSKQHAELLQSAKVWMKETAQSGSVVAALVATVAYAAEYTVPGGTNQNGLPNLQHSPFFKALAISNTVSLILSLTSLGTFLNIMRSPFE
ncbi:ankyrin repeat-containing protein NPR4-like [Prunus avium]|uniref:Ankyrin repeat-containing protein NPR4-like n=1 Tax=Prunus avium TaxID=42229 RepID=A0A6P5SXA9_PRUAV|nr:ankyrin repeat-containing protein NPR4-like [Prunus avium]